jgi:uncharacterized protein YjdB
MAENSEQARCATLMIAGGELRRTLVPLFAVLLMACGGAGGGANGDWYYHWNCNGDPHCLAANPTGQPSGSADEGNQVSCNQLMQFGQQFWGSAATQSCDQNPTFVATLVSIGVSPVNGSIALGLQKQYVATGVYSDGSSQNITSLASWSSGANVTVNAGLVTGVALGTTTVNASYAGKTGGTNVTVTAATLQSISIAPASPTVAAGLTLQLSVIGHFSDGSTQTLTGASWSSATPAVATVDAASGLAKGLAAGTSTIAAQCQGLSANAVLTVTQAVLQSIAVTPANGSVHVGFGLQMVATGTYSDGTALDITTQVTWISGTPSIAGIGTTGLASGLAGGSSTIGATLGAISGSTTLNVVAATLQSITVLPSSPSIAPTWTVQFTAVGRFSDATSQILTSGVTWKSSATSVATILSSGLATGVAAGTTTISATSGIISGNTVLTVSMNPPGLTWTTRFPTTTTYVDNQYVNAMVWTGTQFLGVGCDAGTVFTSPDGVTWTTHVSQTTINWSLCLNALAWSGTRFVAAGNYNTIMTSTDGLTWTMPQSGGQTIFNGAVWTGTQFVLVGNGGVISSSPDGNSWTSRTSGTTQNLYNVAWSGVELLAVGGNGTILASHDGITWSVRTTGTTANYYRGVAWTGSNFIVVGDAGTVLTSTDGINWTTQTPPGAVRLYNVIWTGTQYVVVGGLSTASSVGYIATSQDGVTWTPQPLGATSVSYSNYGQALFCAAWSGTTLVAAGAYDSYYFIGLIQSSP